MTTRHRPGDLQLAILRVLWLRGEARVGEVHEDLLDARDLAPTTVATMLRKMEARGLVDHRTEGRQFVYRATVDEDEVHRSMVDDLLERVFDGDAGALVQHLIDEGQIDGAELTGLRARVQAARRGRGGRS